VNDEYPYEIDNAVTEKLRSRDALAAWDALHELADAILDRAISLSAARPKLEARLLSLLKHLVDTGAPLTVDPELARRTIIERLRKPAALEDVLDEFRALVHDILAPCRFDDYLGVERQRLSAYLETIARKRLKRRSGATGTVEMSRCPTGVNSSIKSMVSASRRSFLLVPQRTSRDSESTSSTVA
jgi:hypothetical protein